MVRQYDMETAIYDQEEAEALAMGEWETFLGEKKEEGAAVMDAHIDIRLENGSCISYGTVTVQEENGNCDRNPARSRGGEPIVFLYFCKESVIIKKCIYDT